MFETNNELDREEADFIFGLQESPQPKHTGLSETIGNCLSCQRELAWPAPRPDYWASPVPCPQCNHWYFTETRNRTTPKLQCEIGRRCDSNPGVTSNLLIRLLGKKQQLKERRGSIRYPIAKPLVGVPLNQEGSCVREAASVTLINISRGGALVVTGGDWQEPLLLLDFSVLELVVVQVLAEVVWRETIGDYTKLGCKFLHSLGSQLPFASE